MFWQTLQTGEILAQINGDVAQPSASVTNEVTALYALDELGAAFRFITRIFATEPINEGILDGDVFWLEAVTRRYRLIIWPNSWML